MKWMLAVANYYGPPLPSGTDYIGQPCWKCGQPLKKGHWFNRSPDGKFSHQKCPSGNVEAKP